VLTRIFGPSEATHQADAVRAAARAEDGSWKEVFARSMRKRLTIALMLAIICQITGINTVFYYGAIIISESLKNQTAQTALAANIFIGVVNLVFTILSMFFLDRWGRRPMLILAIATMTVSLIGISIAFHRSSIPMMLIFVFGYTASFAFAMGTVPWIVISEIFPTKVRSRAASLATSALWATTLLVTSTFLSLLDIFGSSGTFAIYAFVSFLCLVYIWVFVPETGRRTLEEIQLQLER
jgi:SP family arabinose:H+ symporter-like MFS transporter